MPPKKSVQLSGVVVAQTELCSIDAERGILRYRGYDIADLAEHASYEEVAYLLTIVARHHRLRSDEEPIPPDPTLPYAENFLAMLRGRTPTEAEARAFEVAMIVHAEHELNASTFAARVVAGTGADMHSAIVAAICALKGPTHGGANEAAMRMIAEFGPLEQIPEGVRERLAEQLSHDGGEPNWFARTEATERAVSEQKGLHANVDLYSGPLYRYLGIPEDLFTPLFECSRVAGQAAHVLEQHANNKIIRPAAEYVGPESREYPIAAKP